MLSDQERIVLRLMACGYTDAQSAHLLHLSERTVDTYRRRIFRKLGAVSRTNAVALGFATRQLDTSDISSFPALVTRTRDVTNP